MMYVDRVKANIDFPGTDSIRITTPYRQKTFNLTGRTWIDLEKLVVIQTKGNKITLPDFYLLVQESGSGSPSIKYSYDIYATIGAGREDVIASFDHHEPQTVEVKIYRQKK